MTNEEFKFWLKGYLSLSTEAFLDEAQIKIIINHGNLVKAIDGGLDSFNQALIAKLEDEISCQGQVSLNFLRSLYIGEL